MSPEGPARETDVTEMDAKAAGDAPTDAMVVVDVVVLVTLGVDDVIVLVNVFALYEALDIADDPSVLQMALIGMTILEVCVVLEKYPDGPEVGLVFEPIVALTNDVVEMLKLVAEVVVVVVVAVVVTLGGGGPCGKRESYEGGRSDVCHGDILGVCIP